MEKKKEEREAAVAEVVEERGWKRRWIRKRQWRLEGREGGSGGGMDFTVLFSLHFSDGYMVDITYLDRAVAKGAGKPYIPLSLTHPIGSLIFLYRFFLRQFVSTGALRLTTTRPASDLGRTAGSSTWRWKLVLPLL